MEGEWGKKRRAPVDQIEARQKNQNAFLHYVQESKHKKDITKMKAYINQLEAKIRNFDLNSDSLCDPDFKHSDESVETEQNIEKKEPEAEFSSQPHTDRYIVPELIEPSEQELVPTVKN